jgi:hypothetical protein
MTSRLASPMAIMVSRSRPKLQLRARPGGHTASSSETLLVVQGRTRGAETLSRLSDVNITRRPTALRILLRIRRSCKGRWRAPRESDMTFRVEGIGNGRSGAVSIRCNFVVRPFPCSFPDRPRASAEKLRLRPLDRIGSSKFFVLPCSTLFFPRLQAGFRRIWAESGISRCKLKILPVNVPDCRK